MHKLLVSTYGEQGENLHCISLDETGGKFQRCWSAYAGPNPSFVIERGGTIYVANEVQDCSYLSVWKLEKDGIAALGYCRGEGSGSCHAALWPDNKHVTLANYGSGSFSTFCVEPGEKAVKSVSDYIVEEELPESHAHSTTFVNGFAIGADLGKDALYVFNPIDGRLDLHSCLNTPKGSGPRHVCLSRDMTRLYLATELSNQVMVYELKGGKLSLLQSTSVKQDGEDASYTAEIALTGDGRWLLASVRGSDRIAVLPVERDGLLGKPRFYSAGVEWPRHFIILPGDEFVVVAGQKSNQVVCLRLKEGALTLPVDTLEIDAPVCVAKL